MTQIAKLSFPVIGMHCASCARLIERSLKSTSGVVNAQVNYGSEQASVEYSNTVCSPKDLEKAVQSAGYKAILGKDTQELKEEEKTRQLQELKIKVIVLMLSINPRNGMNFSTVDVSISMEKSSVYFTFPTFVMYKIEPIIS